MWWNLRGRAWVGTDFILVVVEGVTLNRHPLSTPGEPEVQRRPRHFQRPNRPL